MPKKTKREKLIAEQRRLHVVPHAISATTPRASEMTPEDAPASFVFRYTEMDTRASAKSNAQDTVLFSVIRRDLVKTVLLSALAIGAEIFIALRWK